MFDESLNPLESVLNVTRDVVVGRLRMPRARVSEVVTADYGQSFTVYRETTVEPPDADPPESGAVLAFKFHLRFMPEPVVPFAVRAFESLSILTTPFFAGLPGFRTKLWLFDHDTGDYMGVYQWETADHAERYARALGRLMAVLSIPGSVSYDIVEDTSLREYLEDHSPGRRPGALSKARSHLRRLGTGAAVTGLLGTVYWSLVRKRLLRWGATDAELERRLPGHELVPEPAVNSTQAVTIDAPPEDVWPWLVQIGQGRGGFYSYERLEQLVGADIHNVDRIVPEYQQIEEGNEVLLAPKDYPFGSPDSWPIVADLEEERHIVLRPPTDPPSYVWTFMLEPVDGEKSRFIARMRSPQEPSALDRLRESLTWEPAHFLMQRQMLLGIKERAERGTA